MTPAEGMALESGENATRNRAPREMCEGYLIFRMNARIK